MIYTILLLVGAIGVFAQAALGLGHGHMGGGHHAPGHGHAHAGHDGPHGWHSLWTLLSPLTVFGVCLGAGAAGLLARAAHWPGAGTLAAAIVGGLAFWGLVLRPVWGLMLRFASTPGRALEGTIAEQCEALGHFDAQGRGMVKLSVDGQRVRLLAFLEESDRAQAVTTGEKLTVVSVDTHANTCRVARL